MGFLSAPAASAAASAAAAVLLRLLLLAAAPGKYFPAVKQSTLVCTLHSHSLRSFGACCAAAAAAELLWAAAVLKHAVCACCASGDFIIICEFLGSGNYMELLNKQYIVHTDILTTYLYTW